MRIRNSSRVGFSLLSPQLLHRPGSSFAPDPFVEKPAAEEAKQHPIRDASMRRRGGDHLHGPLQEGETDGEVHRRKNQMALTARGLEDRSIFFDADGSKSSVRMNIGGGVSANIIEQALHKNEKEEERLNITGERSSRRRRETNTNNSGAQISQGDARWMEGEARVIPLKKRKAMISSFGVMEKETKTNTCPKKRQRIPKEEARDHQLSQDIDEATKAGTTTTGAKKRGIRNSSCKLGSGTSATSLMEGSRCSRINGRGWRCCQQTLVGYSLCEHHLGKGRLRSMSAVRRRPTHLTRSHPDPNDMSVDNIHGDAKSCCCTIGFSPYNNQLKPEENETTICSKNKRRKLGNMVKARSISSLLNQTPHTTSPNYPTALPLDLIVPAGSAAAAST